MKTILIVAHSPSPNTELLSHALEAAATRAAADGSLSIEIKLKPPFDVDSELLRRAQGIILLTTENFGYMSGALKDMFDRTYYDILDDKRGLPYCLIIRAGKDGTGARRSVESIAKGLGWRAVQEPLILKGKFEENFLQLVENVAEGFTLGVAEGIF